MFEPLVCVFFPNSVGRDRIVRVLKFVVVGTPRLGSRVKYGKGATIAEEYG